MNNAIFCKIDYKKTCVICCGFEPQGAVKRRGFFVPRFRWAKWKQVDSLSGQEKALLLE